MLHDANFLLTIPRISSQKSLVVTVLIINMVRGKVEGKFAKDPVFTSDSFNSVVTVALYGNQCSVTWTLKKHSKVNLNFALKPLELPIGAY